DQCFRSGLDASRPGSPSRQGAHPHTRPHGQSQELNSMHLITRSAITIAAMLATAAALTACGSSSSATAGTVALAKTATTSSAAAAAATSTSGGNATQSSSTDVSVIGTNHTRTAR